jgi:hypothetical protein
MQLSKKDNSNQQEIIDGQQRLTTIILLLKVLKVKYSDVEKLKNIELNWLTTEVNNGVQQQYLEGVLNSDKLPENDSLNPYATNLLLIESFLDRLLDNQVMESDKEDENRFEIDNFIEHILSRIYFVVIETKAGLSKTLQIFNAINTTGLDLNGADIFKIRMFEYLKDYENEQKEVFNKISGLYEKIDIFNKEMKYEFTNLANILNIYKFILIAKYRLNVSLYQMSSDTFFEQLFDILLNNKPLGEFGSNVNNVKLSIKEIDELIDLRFEWEKNWVDNNYYSAEDVCAQYLIWESRYAYYNELIFVLLYQLKLDPQKWEKMLLYNKQINKLFFIYSVRFQKRKGEIFYGFMHSIIEAMVHSSFDDLMKLINKKIGKSEEHNAGWYDLDFLLAENLVENPKRKNLICKLSAMLHEDYTSIDTNTIKEIEDKIFRTEIDIEHIQAYHSCQESEREMIRKEWEDNINSLGNLIILERGINRSIGNNEYGDKKEGYKKSEFKIVKNHLEKYEDWNLGLCETRKSEEREKIKMYLFGQ